MQKNKITKLTGKLFFLFIIILTNSVFLTNVLAANFVIDGETHTMYREFTVDSAMVSGTQTNIPLALSVVQDFGITSDAGNVRITDANDNPLPREIESYDSATGELMLWFKADVSDVSDTTFKMYFGNMSLTEPAVDSTYGSQNVWDSNYVGVWHMNQDPSITAPQLLDSTLNGNHGTSYGSMTFDDLVDVDYGKGIDFDGVNDRFTIPDKSVLDLTSAFTITFVLKPTTLAGTWQAVYGKGSSDGNENYIHLYHSSKTYFDWSGWSGYTSSNTIYSTATQVGTQIYNGVNSGYQYINNVQIAPSAGNTSGTITNSNVLEIGSARNGQFYNNMILSELRISSTQRSASYRTTEYNNLINPSAISTNPFYKTISAPIISNNPSISDISLDIVSLEVGQTLTATVNATDPQGNGTIASYSFTIKNPSGSVFEGPVTQASNVYSFTPDTSGYWVVEVMATDNEANTSSVFSKTIGVSGWWDSNWNYRKQITVTDTSGTELTDFQVLIEFDSVSLISAGVLNSDCSDLRFAGEFGLSELNYWVESGCNTTNTKVWVKVPIVPASGSTNIFMYYGNQLAVSGESQIGVQSVPGFSCGSIKAHGDDVIGNGVYWIDVLGGGTADAFETWCDMETDSVGWTLVLQNNYGVANPTPNWNNVVNMNTLIGNMLTQTSFSWMMGVKYWNSVGDKARIEVGSSPTSISHRVDYDFSLNPANYYALNMSNQQIKIGGNAPGIYIYHNGRPLSTYDADHDSYGSNCASEYGNNPWWYGACWDGSFWGHSSNDRSHWTSSTSDYYNYGAIWLSGTYVVVDFTSSIFGTEETSNLPYVMQISFDPIYVNADQNVTVTVTADDPQGFGTIASYSFTVKRPDSSVFAGPVTQAGNQYSFTPDTTGQWIIETVVTDVDDYASGINSKILVVSSWWDGGWKYGKLITLTDTSGTELTDFQVKLDFTDMIYNNTDLAGSWHFSKTSGTTAIDSSGNENKALLLNGAHFSEGKFGGGVQFDGVDDSVEVADSNSLDAIDAVTLEAWVQIPALATSKPVGTKENPARSCLEIQNKGDSTGDGVYWLDAGGSTAFQAYCDMTTDGGGWTLVWKANNNPGVNTGAVNTSALISPIIDTFAKFSDATINQLKSGNDRNTVGYRTEQYPGYGNNCSVPKIAYFDSSCVFTFKSGGPVSSCMHGKINYDGPWYNDTYISDGAHWCSGHTFNTSIFCFHNGNYSGTLHYLSQYSTYCQYSYRGSLTWVKGTDIVKSGKIEKFGAYKLSFTGSTVEGKINSTSINAFVDPGWNHIVLTYDKNVASNQQKLYVNGVLSAQGALTDSITVNVNKLLMQSEFATIMDEVRVYTRALTESEVQERFNAKASLDMVDLRFTDLSGTQELSYWVENDNKVWVKVPSIPANSSLIIYMYYGNPQAVDGSDGIGVFELFDDFNDRDVSDWTSDAPVITAQTIDGQKGLNIPPTGGSGYVGRSVYKLISLPSSYVVESHLKDIENVSYNYPGGLIISFQDANNWVGLEGSFYGGSSWTERGEIGGADTNWIHNYSPNIIPNDWQKQKVVIPGNGSYSVYINDLFKAEKTLPYAFADNGVGFVKHTNTGNLFADWIFVRKYSSSQPSMKLGIEREVNAPTVTGISLNKQLFEMGGSIIATVTAIDPNEDPITGFDFRVLDGLGNEVLNPTAQDSNSYSFTVNGEPGLWQIKAKASNGTYWSSEFTKEVFVNDSSLAVANLSLSNGVYSNTELVGSSVVLSVGQATGTFVTPVINPVNFNKWNAITFQKTTPGASSLTVDVLNASDDSVLISDVQNGQNISEIIGSIPIKLRVNFTAGSIPTLDALSVSYYTQFKITITDCSKPYVNDVTATAIRVSDLTEFGPFNGTNGQVIIEVPPEIYNLHACITVNGQEKCSWKYNVELV